MNYNKPIQADYFGYPLYLRIEGRKGSRYPTMILSLRETDGQIIYEHPPCRLNHWPELESKYQAYQETHGAGAPFPAEWLPHEQIFRFFRCCFDIFSSNPASGNQAGRALSLDTPLAVFFAVTQEIILNRKSTTGKDRSESTISDERRVIDLLMQREGRTSLRDVLPAHCNNWLFKESEHTERTCARVMRELFSLVCSVGIMEDNPWVGYKVRARRTGQNQASLARKSIELSCFTRGQVGSIIARSAERFAAARHRPIGFAILLILCLRLDLEEICALDCEDFRCLEDFPNRLVVSITHAFRAIPGQRQSVYIELDDILDIRQLELPQLAALYFQLMSGGGVSTGPLLRSETHPERRMTPHELDRRVEEFLNAFQAASISGLTDAKAIPPLKMLQNTAERKLAAHGYEDEELRYIRAKPPQLVSARNYSDFAFPAAVNKRGSMQDRWLAGYVPQFLAALPESYRAAAAVLLPDSSGHDALSAKGSAITVRGESPERRMHLRLKLDLCCAEAPPNGLTFELSSSRGITGSARFQISAKEEPYDPSI